ncbi:MAG TPA: rhodanese-like domain-containing protein [Solirubrobacteraceae bacterium]|nr:rhodanese-like domain-containing protein [Solirubrobacteraceae bacterium]
MPRPIPGELGLVEVDATWGVIQPIELAPGVRTVGELEVIAHLRGGGPAVDTRRPEYLATGTLPGARAIPHDEIVTRRGELDCERPTVMFCNGPQCAATPDAVRALLASGWPPELILYYRGGMHDWMTLGLPLVPCGERGTPAPADRGRRRTAVDLGV